MSVAFFAKGVGNLGWCIVGDVSPARAMGVSGAMFNFCGNLASIVTPIAIGVMINQLGSFDVALMYVAGMGLLGAFSYLFIVGPLKRLQLDDFEELPVNPVEGAPVNSKLSQPRT
ncbi:putative glucarate transporter [compost metagenome]